MITNFNIKNDFYNNQEIYLFFSFILAFSSGSLIINLTLILLLFYFIFNWKQTFRIRSNIELILLISFVFLATISTIISPVERFLTLGILSYLKIIFLFLFFDFFFKKNFESKFKKINNFIVFIFFILIIDVFLQRFFNFELFGNHDFIMGRVTGPYKEELIIGSIILFAGYLPVMFFLRELFHKKKNLIFIIFGLLFFLSIFLTGERMNTIISIFLLFLSFVFFKDMRKNFFVIILSYSFLVVVISLNYKLNGEKFFLKKIESFIFQISHTSKYCGSIADGKAKTKGCIEKPNLSKKIQAKTMYDNVWAAHYLTAIEIWKDYPYFGGGVKSFRYLCANEKYEVINSKRKHLRCSSHPHNFIFEILSENGSLGLLVFLIFISLTLYKSLKILYLLQIKKIKINDFFLIIFISSFCLFIALVWPIKSTGRISSTFYGTMYWFFILFNCSLNNYILKNYKNIP